MDESMKDEILNPFDQFLNHPGLTMLNAALPYVSESMRKPLALYIKSMEINRIMADFDREEVLSACGFEKNTPNPEAMLRAMKMAGGKNASPQIDQLLHMMNLIKAYQSFNEMMQNNPEMVTFLTNMMNQNGQSSPSGGTGTPFDNPEIMSLFSQFMKN